MSKLTLLLTEAYLTGPTRNRVINWLALVMAIVVIVNLIRIYWV